MMFQAPILDNFNRSNEGPPPSSNWETPDVPNPVGMVVSGGKCVGDGAPVANAYAGASWKTAYATPWVFGFTLAGLAVEFDHYIDITDSLTLPLNYSRLGMGMVNRPSWGGRYAVPGVQLYGTGEGGTLDEYWPVSGGWAAGDRVAVSHTGSRLSAWRWNQARGWVELGAVDEPSGYADQPLYPIVYLSHYDTDSGSNALDDFQAGTFTPATAKRPDEVSPLGAFFDTYDGGKLAAVPGAARTELTPVDITFDTELPGGYGPGKVVLARPDDWHPMDGRLLNRCELRDEAGRQAHRGRVSGTPKTGVDVIEIQLEGLAKKTEDDETARFLGRDMDLTRWHEASAYCQALLQGFSIDTDGPTLEWVNDTNGQALRCGFPGAWGRFHQAQAYYSSGGIDIGGLDWTLAKGTMVDAGNTHFSWSLNLCTNELGQNNASTGNLRGGATSGTLNSDRAGQTFANCNLSYDAAGGSEGNIFYIDYRIAVFGHHGLTKVTQGTTTGYLASDMLAILAGLVGLEVGPDSIQPTSWPVPHAAWLDPTTYRAMIDALALTGGGEYPLDWGVYETFFAGEPGTYGRDWRIREPKPDDQGPDVGELCNGVQISFNPGDGTTVTAGPVDSGSDYETDLLQVSDPDHPANRSGDRKWKRLDAGIGDLASMLNLGQLYLRGKNRQEWRGSLDCEGMQTMKGGAPLPPYLMRAGDEGVVEEDPDALDSRRIMGTTYSDKDRKASLTIGPHPDRIDMLMARAGIVVTGAGVG